MIIKKLVLAVTALSLTLPGCATHSDSIASSHVSDVQYANYTCDQVRSEMDRVLHKRDEIIQKQNSNANADAAMMGVGLIIFWPALIGLAATSDNKAEVARMKGEYEALERSSIAKNCIKPEAPKPVVDKPVASEAEKPAAT